MNSVVEDYGTGKINQTPQTLHYTSSHASTARCGGEVIVCMTNKLAYDAAGNRNDATAVDNLNRATTIGGVSRSYDILGNTLTKGSISMTWDVLNRMTDLGSQSYTYRADGMRTKKVEDLSLSWIPPSSSEEMDDDTSSSGYYDPITSTNKPTTRYFYDGQMCMGAASSSDTAGLRRNP